MITVGAHFALATGTGYKVDSVQTSVGFRTRGLPAASPQPRSAGQRPWHGVPALGACRLTSGGAPRGAAVSAVAHACRCATIPKLGRFALPRCRGRAVARRRVTGPRRPTRAVTVSRDLRCAWCRRPHSGAGARTPEPGWVLHDDAALPAICAREAASGRVDARRRRQPARSRRYVYSWCASSSSLPPEPTPCLATLSRNASPGATWSMR